MKKIEYIRPCAELYDLQNLTLLDSFSGTETFGVNDWEDADTDNQSEDIYF